MSEPRVPSSLNDDLSLWLHLGGITPDFDLIRKYRRTACPVEGDDDVDDFEDEPTPDTPADTPPPSPPPDDVPTDETPV